MAVAKHKKIIGAKAFTIMTLKGYSCYSCKYRIVHGRAEDEILILNKNSFLIFDDFKQAHCALHTDIKGNVTRKSILINNTSCKNFWRK